MHTVHQRVLHITGHSKPHTLYCVPVTNNMVYHIEPNWLFGSVQPVIKDGVVLPTIFKPRLFLCEFLTMTIIFYSKM